MTPLSRLKALVERWRADAKAMRDSTASEEDATVVLTVVSRSIQWDKCADELESILAQGQGEAVCKQCDGRKVYSVDRYDKDAKAWLPVWIPCELCAFPPSSEATAEQGQVVEEGICCNCEGSPHKHQPGCLFYEAPPLGSPGAEVEKAASELQDWLLFRADREMGIPDVSEIASFITKHVGQPKEDSRIPGLVNGIRSLILFHTKNGTMHGDCASDFAELVAPYPSYAPSGEVINEAASPPLAQEVEKHTQEKDT